MHKIYQKIGERIRNLRRENGLTQNELADLIRLNSASVSRIECAKRKPSLERIIIIASELNISLSRFFNFDQPVKVDKKSKYQKKIEFLIREKNVPKLEYILNALKILRSIHK